MRQNNYQYELYHYGIPGMKWGHRKTQSFSTKATGHKVAAKVYGLNEKAYRKVNPTLSSMNKAAKQQQLKKAETAQKITNAKSKINKDYRQSKREANAQYRKTIRSERNNYRKKYFLKGTTVKILNASANAFISSDRGSYAAKRGAGYVRNAAIMGLSLSNLNDRYKYGTNVRKAKINRANTIDSLKRKRNEEMSKI